MGIEETMANFEKRILSADDSLLDMLRVEIRGAKGMRQPDRARLFELIFRKKYDIPYGVEQTATEGLGYYNDKP